MFRFEKYKYRSLYIGTASWIKIQYYHFRLIIKDFAHPRTFSIQGTTMKIKKNKNMSKSWKLKGWVNIKSLNKQMK